MRCRMRFFFIFFLVCGTLLLCLPSSQAANVRQQSIAIILPISGAIGPATQAFIHRGLKKAQAIQARVIVLELDTPGGLSRSMRAIIKDILASPIPVLTYVAPSGARAASAGTYILYASHIAAMAPGTNLGAATPVNLASPADSKEKKDKKDQQKTASQKKAINDAKAYIRGLAELRGRNIRWAERAVSHAESLSAQEALKKNVINVIANSIPNLLKQVNQKTVSLQGRMIKLDTSDLLLKYLRPDWRVRFLSVITDPSVAYILLMVGFYGLFFEFMNPGFIVPGVAGAICLVVALYAFHLLPVNYAGLGLIILGLAFMVGELFLPSFGALGVGGLIGFVVGSVLLLRTDVVGYGIPWELIAGVVAATLLFFVLVAALVLRSRRRPVVSGVEGMIGGRGCIVERDGQVWVRVQGELWQVANPQGFKDTDPVHIQKVEGLTLWVEHDSEERV